MAEEPREETREERRVRQNNENYQALGEFIVAFEEMIDATRRSRMFIVSRGDFYSQKLVNVVLHHRAMTAKPLLDIMMALYGAMLNDDATKKAMQLDVLDIETRHRNFQGRSHPNQQGGIGPL